MTAAFLAFNALMLWWFVAERARAGTCAGRPCEAAVKLAFIVTSWALGAVLLSILWLSVERRLGLRDVARALRSRRDEPSSEQR